MFKTTLTVYTQFNPAPAKLEELWRQGLDGEVYVERRETERADVEAVPTPVASFFGLDAG